MGYDTRDLQTKRDFKYQDLKLRRKNIEKLVSDWMTQATTLHSESVLTDKAEVLAQKDGMVATLRATLGV